MTPRTPRIAVLDREGAFRHERLLSAVSELCHVQFVPAADISSGSYAAALLLDASQGQIRDCARVGLRTLAFVGAPMRPIQDASADVSFSTAPWLSPCFRGSALRDRSVQTLGDVWRDPDDDVIAQQGPDVLWLRRQEAGSAVDIVAVPPPALSASDHLFTRFQEHAWFALLPLLHFAQEVSGWVLPPIRACFMFDDPNLHWSSYGYVQYRELAEDASAHNYHGCFATVPLDGWYVHPPAARVFRENAGRLSLLIHGNDHTHFELHRPRAAEDQMALAAQALRRIERLERVSGVQVARVMAAPHGACSEAMAGALLQTGFEAACISLGSLMARNPEMAWPASVGLNTVEFLGGGLPIIPRFNIRSDAAAYARFAGFLGQAVIPVGHHDDLRHGVESLQHIARLINSFGDVRWCDMTTISETNYHSLRDKDVLFVKMYSRRIRLQVPAGVTQLCVEPWAQPGDRGVTVHDAASRRLMADVSHADAVAVSPGAEVMIAAAPPTRVNPHDVRVRRSRLRAIVRRQMCEGRDRLRPIVERALRR